MRVVSGSNKISKSTKYPVVTLGNFDGVHIGHQKILDKTIKLAKKHSGTSILYTFDPHPVAVLSPELSPPLLQTIDQKVSFLEEIGLDIAVVEPFTKSLAKINASDFFENIIVERLHARELVVGYDFTFGLHRSGTCEHLIKLAEPYDIKIHIVDALFHKESLLSSTHIRHYVQNDNLIKATAMLGRCYSITGKIIKGRGIGNELGFHTANLKTENDIIPPVGVYITSTKILGKNKIYNSVTNIGYNPTFGKGDLSIETHLLDFSGNLKGKKMELFFHKKTRREMTFESPEALKIQISKDVEESRRYHEKRVHKQHS